jgi:cobyrinic acid a,c-diamide synthase
MPERHLGLQPAEENRQLGKVVESMAGLIAQELDLSAILNLARQAAPLPAINNNVSRGHW